MNYHHVEFLTSFGDVRQLPQSQLPEIVFAGRSNVGKSSLINKLFNQKSLARVSSTPGKTATINFFQSKNLMFVDLPGYGYAKVGRGEKRRWASLIEGYFAQNRDIALVFSLIDCRHAPTSDDLTMLDFLIDHQLPFVVVLTKLDKLSPTQRKERLAAFAQELPCGDQVTAVPVSADNGEGIDLLQGIIDELENALLEEKEEETLEETDTVPEGEEGEV